MSDEQKAHDLTLAYISFMSSIKSEDITQEDFYQDYKSNYDIFLKILRSDA